MRHRKTVKKLGRTASHRKATLRNLAAALIEHRQIRTTLTKAKAAQQFVERLITKGKEDTVHARRQVFKALQNRTLVKILFDEIAPAFADRNGGYTRVIKLGQRRGDGAQVAVLQLVGFEELRLEESPKKKKKKPKQKPVKAEAPAPEAEAAEPAEEAAEAAEAPEAAEPAEEAPPEKKAKAGKKKTSGKKASAKKSEEPAPAEKEAEESPAEEKEEKKEAKPKKKSPKSGKDTDKKEDAAGEGEQKE
ncbi:MAG: 50S ribosomal protein L17 [Calditrichaeota bacterium]|nr:MAG: 50S ribosomal protein L17 [Calditrichota bacterium]